MTINFVNKVCPVCGKEAEYKEINSYSVFGSPGLDRKPNNSMKPLGEEIQECPYCHYCNYDISKLIESRFANNLELWNNDEEIQEIIKTETGALRKYLLLAKMYENKMDYLGMYYALINAGWLSEKEKAKKYLHDALSVYIWEILPTVRSDLMQLADIARQCEYFDVASDVLGAVHHLINEDDQEHYKFEENFIHYELSLIEKQNSAPHNIDEIPEQHEHK